MLSYIDVHLFQVSSALGAWYVVDSEISDRAPDPRSNRRKLEICEAFLQAAIDLVPDSMALRDPEGGYLLINQAAVRMIGVCKDAIRGQTDEALFPPEIAQEIETASRRTLAPDGPQTIELEFTLNGAPIQYYITRVVCHLRGELIGTVAIARDLTDQRRVEEELKGAVRLASVGQLAAVVAHEINNPLAGIRTAFQVIREEVAEDSILKDFVPRIEKEIDRIADIVHQMYGLYRPDREASREFSLRRAIRETVDLLQPQFHQRGVEVKLKLPSKLINISTVESLVRQVLFNMITNALEASQRGQSVEISAEADRRRVTIAVTDHGEGIPPELRDKIFDPLFTTKKRREGPNLGLGLSTAKDIVGALRGSIEVDSTQGKGATFRITLPRGDRATKGVS